VASDAPTLAATPRRSWRLFISPVAAGISIMVAPAQARSACDATRAVPPRSGRGCGGALLSRVSGEHRRFVQRRGIDRSAVARQRQSRRGRSSLDATRLHEPFRRHALFAIAPKREVQRTRRRVGRAPRTRAGVVVRFRSVMNRLRPSGLGSQRPGPGRDHRHTLPLYEDRLWLTVRRSPPSPHERCDRSPRVGIPRAERLFP